MSRTYRNCQSHVQRLRVNGKVPFISGSRGCVPGVLRHLLSPCCSNPRRDEPCSTVRLCECMPWSVAGVKSAGEHNVSEIPAKIAAFPRKALSRIQYQFRTTACWLEARTGASSPFSFSYAMPP